MKSSTLLLGLGPALPPVSLVIPVFNEEVRLHRNARALFDYASGLPDGSRLIIVDDGSSDRSLEIARSLAAGSRRIDVVTQQHTGKGAAVEHGLNLATTAVAGYTDVDLSTPLHEVDRLIRLAGDARSLVIGSRGVSESKIVNHQRRPREWLGRLFNLLVRSTIAPGIRDTQCGAKFANTETWHSILAHTNQPGFAWDAEVVALAMRLGHGVREIGIEWAHDPMTRVDVLSDGLRMATSVLQIARQLRESPATAHPESVPQTP